MFTCNSQHTHTHTETDGGYLVFVCARSSIRVRPLFGMSAFPAPYKHVAYFSLSNICAQQQLALCFTSNYGCVVLPRGGRRRRCVFRPFRLCAAVQLTARRIESTKLVVVALKITFAAVAHTTTQYTFIYKYVYIYIYYV